MGDVMKRTGFFITLCATTSLFVAATTTRSAPAQSVTPAKARYAMDVGTQTGLAAMAGRGMGGAMSMMFGGGGGGDAHELRLRLGSTLTPTGGVAKADHHFTPPAKLGKLVPLVTPQSRPQETMPGNMPRPKGRMLIYWGCGAKAPKGQPVIIDFAKVAAGQMPPNLFSVRVPMDHGPSVNNSKTYGEWPNGKSTKMPSSASSIIGAHRIAGTYSPEISFTLAQDYMPGIRGQAADLAGGAINLSWNSVTAATGYYAWVMGMKMGAGGSAPQDMVWWSSSSAREFGGGLWDWLPPATVQRLIGEKVVLPPSQTQCTVPAEVKAAAPDFIMGNLFAYGPEASFVYPPRPASTSAPWVQEWTARVRYRSTTTWMIGGGMAGGMAGQQQDRPKCKPSILGAVLGAGC
jgi:hypothetical protein